MDPSNPGHPDGHPGVPSPLSPHGFATEFERQLEARLKRVQEALERSRGPRQGPLESLFVAAGTEALEQAREHILRKGELRRRRWEARQREREERRRRRDDEASPVVGVVLALVAVATAAFAFSDPTGFFWMIFVAIPFAVGSARTFARVQRSRRRQAREAAGQADRPLPPYLALAQERLARVDAVCDRILADLKAGPEAVRQVVQRPEETLKALRAACAELARREAELRAVLSPDEEARLKDERDRLVSRIGCERDDVVRLRLGEALRALDEQLAQRAELAVAASRYEAEGTRILYTLESLHTQVLRARSRDASSHEVVGVGLRHSLEQLSAEVDAVADALDSVHRDSVPAAGGDDRTRPLRSPATRD